MREINVFKMPSTPFNILPCTHDGLGHNTAEKCLVSDENMFICKKFIQLVNRQRRLMREGSWPASISIGSILASCNKLCYLNQCAKSHQKYG